MRAGASASRAEARVGAGSPGRTRRGLVAGAGGGGVCVWL